MRGRWEAALELAAEGGERERPLILIVDEFPYLVAKEPSIEAVMQKVWDRALQSTPALILLIGSDEATMRALTLIAAFRGNTLTMQG